MASVKHALRERLFIIRQVLRDADVENIPHVAFDRLEIMKANCFQACSSSRCYRYTSDKLLDVLTDERIKRRNCVLRARFVRSTRIDAAADFWNYLLAKNMQVVSPSASRAVTVGSKNVIECVTGRTVVAVLLALLRVVECGLFGQCSVRSIRDRIEVNHVLAANLCHQRLVHRRAPLLNVRTLTIRHEVDRRPEKSAIRTKLSQFASPVAVAGGAFAAIFSFAIRADENLIAAPFRPRGFGRTHYAQGHLRHDHSRPTVAHPKKTHPLS